MFAVAMLKQEQEAANAIQRAEAKARSSTRKAAIFTNILREMHYLAGTVRDLGVNFRFVENSFHFWKQCNHSSHVACQRSLRRLASYGKGKKELDSTAGGSPSRIHGGVVRVLSQ